MSYEHVPGPPPGAKSNKTLITILVVVGVFLCGCVMILPAILFPVFSQAKHAAITTNNIAHLKAIGTGAMIYAADFDDHLPPAESWTDLITPRLSDQEALHSPSNKAGTYGYAMNKVLGRVSLASIPSLETTPLFFNTTLTGPNAAGGLEAFAEKVDRGEPAICFASSETSRIKREMKVESFDWNPKLDSLLDNL